MMFLLNKYVIGGLLILALLASGKVIIDQRQEIKRQSLNFDVLSGEKEASEQALILSKKEFKKVIAQDKQIQTALRDSLKIKNKQVVRLSKSSAATKIVFKTVLKDSIVYDSTGVNVAHRLSKIEFKDTWNSVVCLIDSIGNVNGKVSVKDTIVITQYKYKKGKWFIPKLFSKTQIKEDIVNFNPSANYHLEKRIEKM